MGIISPNSRTQEKRVIYMHACLLGVSEGDTWWWFTVRHFGVSSAKDYLGSDQRDPIRNFSAASPLYWLILHRSLRTGVQGKQPIIHLSPGWWWHRQLYTIIITKSGVIIVQLFNFARVENLRKITCKKWSFFRPLLVKVYEGRSFTRSNCNKAFDPNEHRKFNCHAQLIICPNENNKLSSVVVVMNWCRPEIGQ